MTIQAHFAASYLVPLDARSQGAFGGLLRWAWPWADVDSGLLGTVTTHSGFPVSGFFVAVTVAGLFPLAALAVLGFWLPFEWWRMLAIAGAALSLFLMAMFFGPTKLLPMVGDLVVLWAALTTWSLGANHPGVARMSWCRCAPDFCYGSGARPEFGWWCPAGFGVLRAIGGDWAVRRLSMPDRLNLMALPRSCRTILAFRGLGGSRVAPNGP